MKQQQHRTNAPSRRRAIFTAAALGAAAGAVNSATSQAGTRRHDRADQLYRDLANEPQFDAVGYYSAGSQAGSFTLIAPNWALTAAHVVDTDGDGSVSDEGTDTLRIGGQTRSSTRIVVPTGVGAYPGWNGNINSGFDIALVEFATPFTDVEPAAIYTSFQELGSTVTQVGYGSTGTGTTGATTGGGPSSKRAGQNVADRYVSFANGATALRWDFDEPSPGTSPNWSGSGDPLDLEYLLASGDSGGGSFIFENGSWFVAGVHSGTYPSYTYPGAANNSSTYGDEALVTRVAAYQEFIFANIPELDAIIPEPAAVSVLSASAGVGLTLRRRRRA